MEAYSRPIRIEPQTQSQVSEAVTGIEIRVAADRVPDLLTPAEIEKRLELRRLGSGGRGIQSQKRSYQKEATGYRADRFSSSESTVSHLTYCGLLAP
jgi:hypothetical protein